MSSVKARSRIVLRAMLALGVVGVIATCRPYYAHRKARKIDELVQRYREIGKFNGCLLVAEDGKIIYHKALGMANAETEENLRIDSQFRLASVSKQFTAMAIMILHEQGKLAYDEDVRAYLSDLPYSGITVRQLLTHTSGLPDRAVDDLVEQNWDTANIGRPERKVITNKDVYDLLVKHHPPVLFRAGERHQYCNIGYLLLAEIVEGVSGMEFDAFMKTNIFDPLGMDRTLVYSPLKNQAMPHRAYGFELSVDGTEYLPDDDHYQNGIAGSGGIYSTTGDMFKWDRALYTEKLVSRPTLDEAFTPAVLSDSSRVEYGFGWSVIPVENGVIVAHGGGWVGFRTFILRDITADKTVIQLCNMPGIHKGQLAFTIWDILHNREYALPRGSIAEVLLQTTHREGLEAAIQRYHELKADYPDKYAFDEGELNRLGYQLLGLDRIGDAIEIFRLNAEIFPESFNVYDSLGEAFMKNGERALAIENYEKSLELNPENANATAMLKLL